MFESLSPYLCSTASLSHLLLFMGAFLGNDAFWLLCNFVRNRCIDCPLMKGSVISKYLSNLENVLVMFKQRLQTFAVFAEASSGVKFFKLLFVLENAMTTYSALDFEFRNIERPIRCCFGL